MGRTFWIAAGVVVCLLAGMVWVSAQSTFLYVHPGAKDTRIIIDYETGAAVVAEKRSQGQVELSDRIRTGVARAEIPQREFHFGTMNPLTMGRHDFVVRNTGTAPLELKLGGTSCKCTLGRLSNNRLPPGGETNVTLEWNTGRHPEYAHGGTLLTNDPQNSRVELRVTGRVITVLSADVPEIIFPTIDPGAAGKAETFLYSQVWDGFEVVGGQCGLEGITWEVETVADHLVPEDLHSSHAQLLRVTTSADLPTGEFNDVLRLEVEHAASGERRQIELPIHGTVGRRLAIYGPAIDAQGIIDLGRIPVGKGKKVKVLVKVRDADPAIEAARLIVKPEWLKAELTRHPADAGRGLYDLTVELPSAAPPCQYLGNPLGQLRIDTGHPRIGVVELGVTFAVLPRS